MISIEEMAVVSDQDGVTVRRLETDGEMHWAITRRAEASTEAIARALTDIPNPTGFRFDFPIRGEMTYEFHCMN